MQGKSSCNQVRMAIDTGDCPIAQTKAKAVYEKSQAISREIEKALAKIGKGKPSAAKKYDGLAVCLVIVHD